MLGKRRLALASAVSAAAITMGLMSAPIVNAASPPPAPSAEIATHSPQELELLRSDRPKVISVDPSTGRVLSVTERKPEFSGGQTVHLDPNTGQVLSLSENDRNH
jgi:hypothetical protein